ncbi:hypothetical protein [Thermomonospora echinospora]|uniref:hypothetical protein n=1 Tax=Thermomonospora echinospora TaxID=1992 RepID=UPI0011AFFB8C|nr:hypothetical protein [Thermomonospora echinospora]
MDAAASALSAVTGFAASSRVRLQGTHAVLTYGLDRSEVERRRLVGLGAVTSPGALRLLLGLPIGVPVPMTRLGRGERAALRSAPRGVVRVEAGSVIRLAVPPVEVGLAMVPARSWRQGLELAGRFAPFCSRAMVLRRRPRDLDVLRMEADFYGIGVIVADEAEPEIVVPPQPFERRRFTAAGWLFLEETYQQVALAEGR